MGLAITTLVVGKKMLPKGIFFFLFFPILNTFEITYWLFKGQKAFPPCHMLVSRTREIKTGQHEKK